MSNFSVIETPARKMGSLGRATPEPPSPPPTAELRSKLVRVLRGHEEVKSAFHRLQSQIQIGLLQAEDVFASLAIPLMKLVGLKTVQMATEGRFTSFIIQNDDSDRRSHPQSFGSGSARSDRNRQCTKIELYASKAAAAGDLVVEKQKDQLVQLVRILKQIESQVNDGQSHMVQTLADRRHSLRRFFQRAVGYLSAVDHRVDLGFQAAAVGLLLEIFNEVSAVLETVQDDVEGLVEDLAEKMCEPMVEYVEGVKKEWRNGSCLGLVALVKEMAKAAGDSRAELEAARDKVKVAEESRAEAMRRLRESEEYVRRMKKCFKLLAEQSKGSSKVANGFATHKAWRKIKRTNDKLLWELLEKKRKYQTPESQLLPLHQSNNKRQKAKHVTPSPSSSNSYSLRSRTPRTMAARVPLGSSPSVTTHLQGYNQLCK